MPEPAAPSPGPDSTVRPGPSPDGRTPDDSRTIPDITIPPMPSEATDAHTRGQRPAAGGLRRVMRPMRKMMRRTGRRP